MSKLINRREAGRRIAAALGIAAAAPVLAGEPTPTQIEGPFYPVHDADDLDLDLTRINGRSGAARGETILVNGRVLDPDGRPLANATVDVWQANHFGRYDHPEDRNPAPLDPNFQGWGIVRTDAEGRYRFRTIMPGAYAIQAGADAPVRCRHIHFKVSHDGHVPLTTQMYFDGDPLMDDDIVLAETPREDWPHLIATSLTDADSGLPLYRFDVVLAVA